MSITDFYKERRADRREDRQADRDDRMAAREQDRQDAEAAHRRAREEAERARAEEERRRTERREQRRATIARIRGAVSEHMPTAGLPVVAVSLLFASAGQVDAARAAGFGTFAYGVPVITEGFTLTLAWLTAHAISTKRPSAALMAATWTSALVAAGINGFGHWLDGRSAESAFRAVMFGVASLAGVLLWWIVMRAKRKQVNDTTAAEVARHRRMFRHHPVIHRRARRAAVRTGQTLAQAWADAWERSQGAPPEAPTTREIKSHRRAAFKRTRAEAWDGRRWYDRGDRTTPPPAHREDPGDESAAGSGALRAELDAFLNDLLRGGDGGASGALLVDPKGPAGGGGQTAGDNGATSTGKTGEPTVSAVQTSTGDKASRRAKVPRRRTPRDVRLTASERGLDYPDKVRAAVRRLTDADIPVTVEAVRVVAGGRWKKAADTLADLGITTD
ncbi:hypothetical protein ACFT0G_06020 [Streptomyces sp. NPDC057020]|uniref:hypothetical protein n=1 Tax=unclassified Streptomyces TaxID=2593676 RepID=UPI0036445122